MKKSVAPILLAFVVAGCASLTAPVQIAETPEQKAFALYGTYVTLQESVADIVEATEIDGNTLETIKEIDRAAYITANTMRQLAQAIEDDQQEYWLNDGVITPEEMNAIMAKRERLKELFTELEASIKQLSQIIKEIG